LCRPIIGAHSASIRGEDGISSSPGSVGVTVEYFPSDSTHHRSERLEIRCGDRWVPLYLECYPTLSCLNSGYQQKASKEMSQYLGGNALSIWRGLLQPPHLFCKSIHPVEKVRPLILFRRMWKGRMGTEPLA
jgi:hypothetical protein